MVFCSHQRVNSPVNKSNFHSNRCESINKHFIYSGIEKCANELTPLSLLD